MANGVRHPIANPFAGSMPFSTKQAISDAVVNGAAQLANWLANAVALTRPSSCTTYNLPGPGLRSAVAGGLCSQHEERNSC